MNGYDKVERYWYSIAAIGLSIILNFGLFYPIIGMGIVISVILLEISVSSDVFRWYHLALTVGITLFFTLMVFYMEINKRIRLRRQRMRSWKKKNF